jgi:hypothetical protein
MWSVLLYAAVLLAACGFAFVCGSRDERLGAASFLVASIASSSPAHNYAHVELVILGVDLVLAALLLYLLFRSKAYWPIWATAFHLVTVVTHFCTWVQPDILPIAYATFGIAWAYPVLFSLMWGTSEQIHFKQRRARGSV